MREIEVKILNVDRNILVNEISKLGAEKIFDGEIKTFFFDFSDSRVSKSENVLRLRQTEQSTLLTFKVILNKETAKEAEEYEVKVSDFQTTKKILEALGLLERGNIQKHRISYKLKNIQFDIDTHQKELSYVPTFMEIEAENIDLIYKYAELLGYKSKDCLPWSTEDVINHYSKKKDCLIRSVT
jgi:predicted adenylyl cyclase CyaB